MFQKKSLQEFLLGIQKQIEIDLCIGSGNKSFDLIKTNNWSGEVSDHIRNKVRYEKSTEKGQFAPNFYGLKLKPSVNSAILSYAFDGSEGLLARGGNCQEFVGLAIYYILKKNNDPNLVISTVEYKKFDHVFLNISNKQENLYYDPWRGTIFPTSGKEYNINNHETVLALIKSLEIELGESEDHEAKLELKKMINNGMKILDQDKIEIIKEDSLKKSEFKTYCSLFDKHYQAGLQELYPGKTRLPSR